MTDADPTAGMRIAKCPHCGEELSVWPVAAGVTVGLDVERLARAMFAWDRSEHSWVQEADWPLAAPRWESVASIIAAEYDRLGAK